MNVREFLSNDQTFNEQLPKSDRARMSQIKKILGIKWNPHKDHIQITLNPWTEQTTTKELFYGSSPHNTTHLDS
ncbi:hypothetical protein QQG55_45320 [Brugia pahangi]